MSLYCPKPFGYPLFKGMKRRVAKKWCNPSWKGHTQSVMEWLTTLEDIRVGDLFSGCDGLNTKLVKVEPEYTSIHGGGEILVGMNLFGETNGCSLFHCGVRPPKTYEECSKYVQAIIKAWGKDDKWGFAEKYGKMELNLNGTPNYKDK